MKTIVPILLLVASIGIFIGVTNPQYQAVKNIQTQVASLNDALDKSVQILNKRSQLEAEYNSFSSGDLGAIDKILPDDVDNVQLALDMNGIARNHGMSIRNIKIQDQTVNNSSSGQATLGPNNSPVGSLVLSFEVTGDYQSFVAFLKDLEQSLRIVDVIGVDFQATDTGDAYDYLVSVRTYWLK